MKTTQEPDKPKTKICLLPTDIYKVIVTEHLSGVDKMCLELALGKEQTVSHRERIRGRHQKRRRQGRRRRVGQVRVG